MKGVGASIGWGVLEYMTECNELIEILFFLFLLSK